MLEVKGLNQGDGGPKQEGELLRTCLLLVLCDAHKSEENEAFSLINHVYFWKDW